MSREILRFRGMSAGPGWRWPDKALTRRAQDTEMKSISRFKSNSIQKILRRPSCEGVSNGSDSRKLWPAAKSTLSSRRWTRRSGKPAHKSFSILCHRWRATRGTRPEDKMFLWRRSRQCTRRTALCCGENTSRSPMRGRTHKTRQWSEEWKVINIYCHQKMLKMTLPIAQLSRCPEASSNIRCWESALRLKLLLWSCGWS